MNKVWSIFEEHVTRRDLMANLGRAPKGGPKGDGSGPPTVGVKWGGKSKLVGPEGPSAV